MAFADNLPVSESLGVFVGVAGFDWLADGQAEPIKAVVVAIAAGVAIMAARHWRKSRRKN
ncbi:MAG: hypothetical protein CVU18_10025 [Betaproteobacteria bacterium HGW-Betaproteobacteria-12]|jgi:hypothetical protein|nr:MAG: hypothetical protein CVU18_10025 [Betaproteobacteria bacterium HGW-Betaproteobacteria-12]